MKADDYSVTGQRLFAVVDVETTGLNPASERIIEIGVILLDGALEVQKEWSSLVNPGIPVTASKIHGLRDSDVQDAPSFGQIATELVELLSGRLFVAHNASFDQQFLNREFARARLYHTIYGENLVDTLDQSRIYCPPGSHSLLGLSQRLGIADHQAHRSLSDAHLCADLLRYFVGCENRQQRFTDTATNRAGQRVSPAQWLRAQAMKFTR